MGPAVDGADCGEGQVVRRWRMGWRGGDGVATDGERGKRRGGRRRTGAAADGGGGSGGRGGRRWTGAAADGSGGGWGGDR